MAVLGPKVVQEIKVYGFLFGTGSHCTFVTRSLGGRLDVTQSGVVRFCEEWLLYGCCS